MSLSVIEIKRRLAGVRQTRQITNAMYLLSAAGLKRGAGVAADAAQYAERIEALFLSLVSDPAADGARYLREGGGAPVYVCFFGDKGLCGGFQHALAKYAAQLKAQTPDARFFGFGRRAQAQLRAAGVAPEEIFPGGAMHPDPADAGAIAARLLRLFTEENCRSVELVFCPYHRVEHTPGTFRLFPAAPAQEGRREDLLTEPGAKALLAHILPVRCRAQVYSAMVQSAAGENAARMDAMRSAVDNADGMIAALEQEMHAARQLSVTNEITEIAAAVSLQERVRRETRTTESGGDR